MTTEFSNPVNCTPFKHFQNYFHSEKVSLQVTSEISPASGDLSILEAGTSPETSRIRTHSCSSGHFSHRQDVFFNTTSQSNLNPWPLLPKANFEASPKDIHLVVHGSSGGRVHDLVSSIASAVSKQRGCHVQVEALTAGEPPLKSCKSVWLVPLFLLPGTHVRYDIPQIRDRLRMQAVEATLLPFLGSWNALYFSLLEFIRTKSEFSRIALIHHPLRPGIASRYLFSLKKRLQVPIISWDHWKEFQSTSKKKYYPIPFALTPNRNTTDLLPSNGPSSLLEIQLFKSQIIRVLGALP